MEELCVDYEPQNRSYSLLVVEVFEHSLQMLCK